MSAVPLKSMWRRQTGSMVLSEPKSTKPASLSSALAKDSFT
jgi:hypothetical protein